VFCGTASIIHVQFILGVQKERDLGQHMVVSVTVSFEVVLVLHVLILKKNPCYF